MPAGFTFASQFLEDLDEEKSVALFVLSAESLGVPLSQLFDEFGSFWCCSYAPKMYPQFFAEAKSTKDLLTNLDHIHQIVTNKKPGVTSPRFTYR